MIADRRPQASLSRGSRTPAALATLAAPVLLYLIVRTALFGLGSPAALSIAALPPADYAPFLRSMVRIAAHPSFTITGEMAEMNRTAAIASPLAYEPFFMAAREQSQGGRVRQAISLFEEARRRRPSHLPTRMHLLVSYAQTEHYAEALAEMDTVLRLSQDARSALLPELTKLIAIPSGRIALASVLAREPVWREDFLRLAAGQKLKPQDTRALLELVSARKKGGDVTLERELYLRSLLAAQDYARARTIWLASLPANVRAASGTLFDGSFRGLKAAEPFGWGLRDVDVGRAEIVESDGRPYLNATYFGGRNVVLAEQVLALTPGTYRLSVVARSREGIKPDTLSWRTLCLPNAQELITVKLDRATPSNATFGGQFIVPAGDCKGQKLLLMGEAGDVSSASTVQVAEVRIAR